ncbi:MAG: dCTP deaminase [Candidatus Paceibacterota bacterium]
MYLSDIDIEEAVKRGDIILEPFDKKRLQPASYDIQLGNKFLITDGHKQSFIDPEKKIFPELREVVLKDGDEFILHPGVVVLGFSHDYFGSKRYLIHLNGKSSLARIGLVVHNTAGLVNPGHFLNIVFELYNTNTIPIILRPKMNIAQLTFSELLTPPKTSYEKVGRYGKGEKNWKGGAAPKKRK